MAPPSPTARDPAPRTRSYNVCPLNGFLKERANLVIERRRLRLYETPVHPRRALDPEQARRLLEVASRHGIVTHAVVAFEMLMGLRRGEVLRVALEDLETDSLPVHGNGRAGGKTRWVPYHGEVRRILPDLLAHRGRVLEGHEDPPPRLLFAHIEKRRTVRPWGSTYLDDRVSWRPRSKRQGSAPRGT